MAETINSLNWDKSGFASTLFVTNFLISSLTFMFIVDVCGKSLNRWSTALRPVKIIFVQLLAIEILGSAVLWLKRVVSVKILTNSAT